MKKFVNDPQDFVPEMLKGIELANPGRVNYLPEYSLIMRADAPRDGKVSIIQGSGSGHEPAHVMIVGKGMLDAACPGELPPARKSPDAGPALTRAESTNCMCRVGPDGPAGTPS